MKTLRDPFFLILFCTGLLSLTGCNLFFKEPESCFDASVYRTVPGNPISFENCSMNGESYLWDFGDGNTSTEEHPTHSYEAYGTYEVSLTSTLKEEKTHTFSRSLTVGDLILEEILIYNLFNDNLEPVSFSIYTSSGSLVRSPSFTLDSDQYALKMEPELILPESSYKFVFDAQTSGERETEIAIYDRVSPEMEIIEENPVGAANQGFQFQFKSR